MAGGFGRRVAVRLRSRRARPVPRTPGALRAAAPRSRRRRRARAPGRPRPPGFRRRLAHRERARTGPVLVQVPRRGYLPGLACQHCRGAARCPGCHGPVGCSPVALPTGRCAGCRRRTAWCARTAVGAGSGPVVGARRTAEELGRAFPGVAVVVRLPGEVLASVGAAGALVIATPGPSRPPTAATRPRSCSTAGPARAGRPTRRRRRCAAGSGRRLIRPAPRRRPRRPRRHPQAHDHPGVEALVRWDPAGLAWRELAERLELGLPPAVTMAEVVGPRGPLVAAVDAAGLGPTVERLGPLPFRAPTPSQTSPATVGPPLAQVPPTRSPEPAPRPRSSPRRHAGGTFGPQGTGVGVGAHGPRRGSGLGLSFRQPPARLWATICRNIASSAARLRVSPSLTPTVRAVWLPWPAVMMPSGSGTIAS